MNTSFFINKLTINYMGFFKTLFTGKRDELSEEEMKQYEEFHNKEEPYQVNSNDLSENNYDNGYSVSSSDTNSLDLEDVLHYIENSATSRELIKIKNCIARLEDMDYKVSEDVSFESPISEDVVEEFEDSNFQSVNDTQRDDMNSISTSTSQASFEDDEYIELENTSKLNNKEENIQLDDDSKIVSIEEAEVFMEKNNNDLYNNGDKSSNENPTLFSVIHDELMELFDSGNIVLLKEKFTFPTLGQRETLAFGIYNSNLSNISDQTHWFIQKLKQFSRLKECKMLLSEENQKDLILEVNSQCAVLLSFKTTELVRGGNFEFNRKWD